MRRILLAGASLPAMVVPSRGDLAMNPECLNASRDLPELRADRMLDIQYTVCFTAS
jgi:hypothetical protein